MVESDDDNTMGRKRRERGFRGERDESSSNSRGSRDHWRSSKKLHHGHGPSSYSKNYGHSPIRYRDHSPTVPYTKRVRRDWDSQENNSYHYPLQTQIYGELHPVREESPSRYAQMLSFKAFLAEQEDNIDESEATARYTEYKTEFRKNQISDFFLAHKEEEWFRLKYDPILKQQQSEKEKDIICKRLKLCLDMYKEGMMDDIRLDMSYRDDLLRFLDTVAKRLEANDQECAPAEQETRSVELDEQRSKNGSDSKLDNSSPPTETKEEAAKDTSDTETTKQSADDVLSENDDKANKNSDDESPTRDDDDSEAHKTSSIFLRSLPASVTHEEIEKLCRKYEGFKRAALADPLPDRRFQRRGWLTFKHGVDIKKICWELNSAKIWPCDVGAIVNRELTRRIRPVDAITNYAPVVQNDLEMAIKVSKCLDAKWSLWSESGDDHKGEMTQVEEPGEVRMADNPFIKAAEQVLLTMETEATKPVQDADPAAKTALDQLLVYLRLVHSIDYYNAVEYQLEDHMPNRCGIMHVRSCSNGPAECSGSERAVKKTSEQPTKSAEENNDDKQLRESINHWVQKCKERLAPFTECEASQLIDLELAKRLGLKDEEEEVERFITQNTVKVVEDRWSCPLSGKKFKGPEFVRKHIFNKHQDKIDKVRRDVACFNNYVLDSKRPQLPEQIITRPIVPGAPMKMGVAFHQECQGFASKHHTSSQSNTQPSGFHTSNSWNSGGGPYSYGGRSRSQRTMHSGSTDGGSANQGNSSARDGRDRETVKYDISYSELEESNFPC